MASNILEFNENEESRMWYEISLAFNRHRITWDDPDWFGDKLKKITFDELIQDLYNHYHIERKMAQTPNLGGKLKDDE